jgi:hypothetical protein
MLVYIAALVFARSWHRELIADIHPCDETQYLANGVNLLKQGLPTPDWAPLYVAWYWLESLVVSDRLALYYVNWSALLFLNLCAAWLIVRRLQPSALVSVLVLAALAVAGAFELPLNVTMLASALVGFGVAVAIRRTTWSGSFAAAAAFMLAGAYVRPELSVAFGVLAVVSIAASIAERKPWCAVPIAAAALALVLVGSPLGNGSRTFLAFGQHYAVNANAALPEGRQVHDPMTTWRRFVDADFGPVNTVGEAVRTAPATFMWHIGRNAEKLARALAAPVTPALDGGTIVGWVIFAAVIAGLLAAVRVRSRIAVITMGIAASAVAAEAVGILIVSPNPQYLMVPVLAVVAAALSALRPELSRGSGRAAALVAAAAVGILPGHAGAAPWYVPRASRSAPPITTMVSSIHGLHALAPGFPLLGLYAQVGFYGDWNSLPIGFPSCPSLDECLPGLGAMIADTAFVEFYSSDPLLPVVLTEPARLGFGDRHELAPGIVLLARPGVLARTASP